MDINSWLAHVLKTVCISSFIPLFCRKKRYSKIELGTKIDGINYGWKRRQSRM